MEANPSSFSLFCHHSLRSSMLMKMRRDLLPPSEPINMQYKQWSTCPVALLKLIEKPVAAGEHSPPATQKKTHYKTNSTWKKLNTLKVMWREDRTLEYDQHQMQSTHTQKNPQNKTRFTTYFQTKDNISRLAVNHCTGGWSNGWILWGKGQHDPKMAP